MNNANQFLQYVAKNRRRLRRNLRKNITYDDEIFDDAFQNAIEKTYNSIIKNDLMVEDFEQYFFIASKNEYILLDNRKKRQKERTVDVDEVKTMIDESEYDEDRETQMADLLAELSQELTKLCGSYNATLFLDYYRMKCEGNSSYKDLAEEYGLRPKQIAETIQKIKDTYTIQEVFYKKYKSIINNE